MFHLIETFLVGIPPDLIVLFEIGVMIIIASFFAFIIRLFKQPLIPAYIITGIIIGPLVFGLIQNQGLINSLSQIGVAFLIFIAGLEIKLSKLKEVGKVAVIGGLLQVAIICLVGFLVSIAFGFSNKAAIYVGLVVAFSSTMIVVKILSEKREINSLHGRIAMGILLIQDVIAIIALIILTSDYSISGIIVSIASAVVFGLFAFIISKIINPVFRSAAKNQELLLIVSISLLFVFTIGALLSRLSLVIGAFFAGVALANSDYKIEIQGKISPLRDFFAVIFFVVLGMQLELISSALIWFFIVLLILVILVKPYVTMFLIRAFGYKKSTSFLTGNAIAQTSEFSLIIVTLGLGLGEITKSLFSSLVLLTIITMSITTYLINYEKRFEKILAWPLNLLNKVGSKNEELEYFEDNNKKVVIFGCHRMGSLLLNEFEKEKKEVMVVDYNPDIIKHLIKKKIPCIYGDYTNEEVMEKSGVKNAEIIISTIPDMENNLYALKKIKKINPNAIIFFIAERISEAIRLYEQGVDYVLLPQVISGQKAFDIINGIKKNKSQLKRLRSEHMNYLDSIHHILF